MFLFMAEIPTIARAQILGPSRHGWVDRARTVAAMFFTVLLPDSHLATGYRHFVSVATLGSVRAASRQLNVAASAISRQIGLLEAQLGINLFERHTRSLAPDRGGH